MGVEVRVCAKGKKQGLPGAESGEEGGCPQGYEKHCSVAGLTANVN